MTHPNDFVGIKGIVRTVRKDSVLFSVGDSVPLAAWVPRSVVTATDNRTLDDIWSDMNAMQRPKPVPMTLHMQRWKAEEAGFTGTPDSETVNLFRDWDSR